MNSPNTSTPNQSTTTAADGSQVRSGSATATGSASHHYSSDWSTHAATTGPDYSSSNDGNGTNSIQAADTYNYQDNWSETSGRARIT
jgi:hypothetical protein